MIIVFVGLLVTLSLTQIVYSELELIESLHGVGDDSEVTLFFSNGVVTGNLSFNDEEFILTELILIERNWGFLISDKEHGLKIISKKINDDEYFTIVKIKPDMKFKLIISSNDWVDTIPINTGQRDLLGEMLAKQKLDELNSSFENDDVNEAQQQRADAIDNLIVCKNKDGSQCLTSSEILADFEQSKIITSDNVPVITRDGDKSNFILHLDDFTVVDGLRLGDTYALYGTVINVVTSDNTIPDAEVTIEISRDDYVIRTASSTSDSAGHVEFEIVDLSYPEFYPRFCYDVKVVSTYLNYTAIMNNDFMMEYAMNTRIWEPDMSWLDVERWDYLPESFRDEPRKTISSDERCN